MDAHWLMFSLVQVTKGQEEPATSYLLCYFYAPTECGLSPALFGLHRGRWHFHGAGFLGLLLQTCVECFITTILIAQGRTPPGSKVQGFDFAIHQ
jgi:hypothetical protein